MLNSTYDLFEILNSFHDSIAVLDSKGVIVFSNDYWKQFSNDNSGDLRKTDLGVNYLEVCGRNGNIGTKPSNGILKVMSAEIPVFEMEYPCDTLYSIEWFLLRATSIKSKPELTLVSHTNITRLKYAEDLMEQSHTRLYEINSKLNSAMFKIVHDIQEPLNNIQGLLNLANDERHINESKQYYSLIEKSVFSLKKFIQQTLKLSKVSDKSEFIFFQTIFEEYYESVKYSENCKKVYLKFNTVQTGGFYTIKSEIVSVISNIISNSFKYYDKEKDNPSIFVSVNVTETLADITIKDNGIGISQGHIDKIFDLNFQVDEMESGAGLGLNMVKKSVDILNGKLFINSKIGEGTEIKIVLPNVRK